jgi:hypothetical protein
MVESSSDELHNESPDPSPKSPVKAERIQRYSLGKLLDHGSFGVVYEGTDHLTGR